jgi:hypothetical protein
LILVYCLYSLDEMLIRFSLVFDRWMTMPTPPSELTDGFIATGCCTVSATRGLPRTTNSKVVAGQIEKECHAREPTLERYLGLVRILENYFKGFTVEYVERNKIFEADELAKAAARNTPMSADIFFQVIEDASVKTVLPEPSVINIIEGEDWRAPIMSYLRHYYEPDSKNEQIRMQHRAKNYQIVSNELYKTSVSGPLLRCLRKSKGQEILREVHVGICGGHIVASTLAAKVLEQGFYWPATIDGATKLVSTCEACQKFSHRFKAPA